MTDLSNQPQNRRVALVIGSGDYLFQSTLANPVRDARLMAKTLAELDFDVIEGLDLTYEEQAGKYREFLRAARGAEAAVFFFAGHGIYVDTANYLIPTKAQLRDEDDLDYQVFEVGEIVKHMNSRAKFSFVFLDSCRDNPLSGTFGTALGKAGRRAGPGMVDMAISGNTIIIFATQAGKTATDGTGEYSPFTAALTKGIKQVDRSAADVSGDVKRAVIASTGGAQRPHTMVDMAEPFYFNRNRIASHPTPSRIVLLGNPTAASSSAVAEVRQKLAVELAKPPAGQARPGFQTVHWADGWANDRTTVTEDAETIFVRVINSKDFGSDTRDLTTLPEKITVRLGSDQVPAANRILVWDCDGDAGVGNMRGLGGRAGGDGDRRDGFIYSNDTMADFVVLLHSRFSAGWPPALRLVHPGANIELQDKLIELIESKTKGRCRPEIVELMYLEPTSIEDDQAFAEKLQSLIGRDANFGGTVVAVHDLNFSIINPASAVEDLHETLSQYDARIKLIFRSLKVSPKKVKKFAVLTNMPYLFIDDKYSYQHKARDWTFIRFERENEEARFNSGDIIKIEAQIDELIGAGP